MKKIVLSISTVAMLSLTFNGCAGSGMNLSGIGKNDVKQVFQKGTIETSQKVLVGKSKLTTLGYATGGAVVGGGIGAGLGDSTKAPVGGAVVGAGLGALTSMFQEVEAYQVDIKDVKNGTTHVAFLEAELPLNSLVEYVVRADGEVTNVNVTQIGSPKEIIKEKVVTKEKVIYKNKIVEKPVIKEVIVEKPVIKEVIKEVAVPVPPVPEKSKQEAEKKVETETKKSLW